MKLKLKLVRNNMSLRLDCVKIKTYIRGDSVARGPKLLSIKNYVIEIMI